MLNVRIDYRGKVFMSPFLTRQVSKKIKKGVQYEKRIIGLYYDNVDAIISL